MNTFFFSKSLLFIYLADRQIGQAHGDHNETDEVGGATACKCSLAFQLRNNWNGNFLLPQSHFPIL